MDGNEGGPPPISKIFRQYFEKPAVKTKEKIGDVVLMPEAAKYLRSLVLRPNPDEAEFAFLGLGSYPVVDQFLVINDKAYPPNSGINRPELMGLMSPPSLGDKELNELFSKLETSGRAEFLMVYGHLHPVGEEQIEREKWQLLHPEFGVPIRNLNLEPSMCPLSAGITNKELKMKRRPWKPGGDLLHYLDLYPKRKFPYIGIAAKTVEGAALRIYSTPELLQIKSNHDIVKVPQKTFLL